MRSSLTIALSLCAACATAACAHGEPKQRNTVSAVGNEDATGDQRDPDNKKMTYTKVSNEDALNQDPASRENEAMHGHLNRGDDPVAALQTGQASSTTAKCDLNIYFETASAKLNERAKQQLNSIASCLKERTVEGALIVGSADPRGSEPDNAELGQERARTVAAYLKELGVPEGEIRVRTLGESQASATPSTYPASRRAQVQQQ